MKVALILPHFHPYIGGGEKMFYDIAQGLVARGHEVHVVAEQVGKEYSGHKSLDGMEVWYCPWKSAFGHPFPERKDIEPQIKWCDIVHTSTYTTTPIVSYLARKYHKPSVVTIYEVRGNKWFWSDVWYKALVYWVVEQVSSRQRFDFYHMISEATKKDFIRFIGKKGRRIRRIYIASEMGRKEQAGEVAEKTHPGHEAQIRHEGHKAVVDAGMEDPNPGLLRELFHIKDEKVFLYYGRPGRTKGIQVYDKAIRLLARSGMDLRKVRFCFLLGAEPKKERKEFIHNMEKMGLMETVRIHDSVSREELQSCIRQADIVVVPSLTEGFGFSALEACQLGTPLIYSDGGSLPEVAFGKCRSFKNRDARDLAEKLRAVIEERPDAFEKVPEKHFTYKSMLGSLMQVYDVLYGMRKGTVAAAQKKAQEEENKE